MTEQITYKVSLRKTKLWIGQNNTEKDEITFYLPKFYDFIKDYLKHIRISFDLLLFYNFIFMKGDALASFCIIFPNIA